MGDRTVAGERCPQCSAALRPGAPWCTQCYAPVGDPAAGPARPAAVGVTVPPVRTPAEQPPASRARQAAVVEGAGWPCDACGAGNPLTEAACSSCGAPFLARARGARPALVLPLLGDVSALRMLPLAAVGLALALALLLTAVVGGALLG